MDVSGARDLNMVPHFGSYVEDHDNIKTFCWPHAPDVPFKVGLGVSHELILASRLASTLYGQQVKDFF